MTFRVLICDDSSFARKQMARALPAGMAGALSFAVDGKEALEIVDREALDLILLDLNMPGVDGYQVLSTLQEAQHPVHVVVVSGDIQPEAQRRVKELGAMGFIKKPTHPADLLPYLQQLGIELAAGDTRPPEDAQLDIPVDAMDSYQELVNVAMGRAGALLAGVLGNFIELSIPKVNLFEGGELHMTLSHVTGRDNVHAVSQGFVARDLAGEAILIFNDASFVDLARLLHREDATDIDDMTKTELLMDMANLLIGACLKGISDQLERPFSEGRPVILGRNARLDDMLAGRHSLWRPTLAVEIGYCVEGHDINCDLLLLFTQDSLPTLDRQLAALGGLA